MKFLSRLRSLFKLSGSQAMPHFYESSGTRYTYTSFSSSSITINAPYDSYACVEGNTGINNARMHLWVNDKIVSSLYGQIPDINIASHIAIQAGERLRIGLNATNAFRSINVVFYKLVGGKD